jgi:hypothetical protein
LVTFPDTDPAVEERRKLTFGVVCPPVTPAVSVCGLAPEADAVSVWLPGVRPVRVYTPEPLVVVLAPPLSFTVAPEMAPPPAALVTVPLTAPVAGVGVALKAAIPAAQYIAELTLPVNV